MTIPDISTITTAGQATDLAIEWQDWQSEQALYMSEVADWADFFRRLADKYDLTDEFSENGIL